MHVRRFWLTALIVLGTYQAALFGCDFCRESGEPFMQSFDKAELVVLARVEADPRFVDNLYWTDFSLDESLKPHQALGSDKKLTVSGYCPRSRVILFCKVAGKNITPLKTVEVGSDNAILGYIKGAIAVKDKAPGDRLRNCFDHLNSPYFEISRDAYYEFARASYKDYSEMARKLPADKIVGWLQDPRTPPSRLGLYSSLLGHCGKPEHAKVLRSMIETSLAKKRWDIDGLLAGYVMLQPKEGWGYLQELLRDGKRDYLVRFFSLRAADFLRVQRPDLVTARDLNDGVALALAQPDLADKAIDFLRKAQCWERTNQILDLPKRNAELDNGYVRRALKLFLLVSPQSRARAFVNDWRRRDPEEVADFEQQLKLEKR